MVTARQRHNRIAKSSQVTNLRVFNMTNNSIDRFVNTAPVAKTNSTCKCHKRGRSQGVTCKASKATGSFHCNTGGYGTNEKKLIKSSFNITKVDWLRVTTTNLDNFKKTMSQVASENGTLSKAGIEVVWTKKGLYGYEKSAKLFTAVIVYC